MHKIKKYDNILVIKNGDKNKQENLKEKNQMLKNLKLKEENMKKIIKSAETRMAVYIYIYIYIVYCHLENKKTKNKNNRSRDRTILKVENSIGLSLCTFASIICK